MLKVLSWNKFNTLFWFEAQTSSFWVFGLKICNITPKEYCFHYYNSKYSEVHFTNVLVYAFHIGIRPSPELVRQCHHGESSLLPLVLRSVHRLLSSRKYSTHKVIWLCLPMLSVDNRKSWKSDSLQMVIHWIEDMAFGFLLKEEDLWMGSMWERS